MKISLLLIVMLSFFISKGNASIFSCEAINDDSIYSTVEQKAYLKNHRKGLEKEIKKAIVYPTVQKMQGIEGVVMIECVITAEGKMENCRVVNSVQPELDQEALRVVYALSPWVPAQLGGVSVASRMTVAVPFYLTENEKTIVKALSPIDFQNRPPLFILDGKAIDGIIDVESYNVRTIRVIKGEKAVARYGDAGRFGVVEMTTKRGTPPVR